MWYLRYAFKSGMTVEDIYKLTNIDPWFLDHLAELVEMEAELRNCGSMSGCSDAMLLTAKQAGYSDRQLGDAVELDGNGCSCLA